MAIAGKYRIKDHRRILQVQKEGAIFQSANFGVCYLKGRNKSLSAFAIVVSTKVSKLAVHRNRIERAITEAVRQSVIDIPKGFEFVFLAKKNIGSRTTEEIMLEVKSFIMEFKKNV